MKLNGLNFGFKTLNWAALLLVLFAAYSCGGSDDEALTTTLKKYSSTDATARETDILAETDLNAMSNGELSNFLTTLRERNKKEAKELKVLADINQELCSKLAEVKKNCTALAPLMSGSYDNIRCSKEDIKNEITVLASGSFKLVGDNLYESNTFGSGESKIDFTSTTGSKDLDVRFIDLNQLELVSQGGNIGSSGLDLKVNGITIFNQSDLEQADGKTRIKLTKLLEISKSGSCNVSRAELDEIRSRVRLTHSE